MQLRQLCTAQANADVHVGLQSEGGFFCVWNTVWHSDVHCGFDMLKVLAEAWRCEDVQGLNRRGQAGLRRDFRWFRWYCYSLEAPRLLQLLYSEVEHPIHSLTPNLGANTRIPATEANRITAVNFMVSILNEIRVTSVAEESAGKVKGRDTKGYVGELQTPLPQPIYQFYPVCHRPTSGLADTLGLHQSFSEAAGLDRDSRQSRSLGRCQPLRLLQHMVLALVLGSTCT